MCMNPLTKLETFHLFHFLKEISDLEVPVFQGDMCWRGAETSNHYDKLKSKLILSLLSIDRAGEWKLNLSTASNNLVRTSIDRS